MNWSPTIQRVPLCLLLVAWLMLLGSATLVGTSRFSVDSWSYIELSKSLLTDQPYQPNTIRSYVGGPWSAAFPPAYPALLAACSLLTEPDPMNGVYLNVALLGGCCLLILTLCKSWGVNASLACLSAMGFLFTPYLVDEVMSARSLPLAAFLLLLGWWRIQSHPTPWGATLGGLAIGLSCLTRFDFLPISAAWFLLWFLNTNRPWMRALFICLGTGLGMAPWVAFSLSHFGVLWASDNSWVATSVTPAHAMDYPTAGRLTLFDAPTDWFKRVGNNFLQSTQLLGSTVVAYAPTAAAALIVTVAFIKPPFPSHRRIATSGICWIAIVLLPMAMTGYQDKRYLVPEMLALMMSASVVMGHARNRTGIWLMSLTLAATAPSFVKNTLQKPLQHREAIKECAAATAAQIKALEQQHRAAPSGRLVFMQRDHLLAAQYGARTGLPTALLPNNLAHLAPYDLEALNQRLGAHWLAPQGALASSKQLPCR